MFRSVMNMHAIRASHALRKGYVMRRALGGRPFSSPQPPSSWCRLWNVFQCLYEVMQKRNLHGGPYNTLHRRIHKFVGLLFRRGLYIGAYINGLACF